MKKFAVLIGSSVSNIIVADSIEDAELATNSKCVEFFDGDYVGIGFEYIDEKFIPPLKPETNEAEAL